MKFYKLKSKTLYWFALKFEEDKDNLNLFYSGLLDSLIPSLYKGFDVNSAAALKLDVISLNIETYLENIKLLTMQLNETNRLNMNWNPYNWHLITLNDLMSSKGKELVDPQQATEQLKERLKELTAVYFKVLSSGNNDYSLKIVRRFLDHVFLNIVKPMIEYSHILKVSK